MHVCKKKKTTSINMFSYNKTSRSELLMDNIMIDVCISNTTEKMSLNEKLKKNTSKEVWVTYHVNFSRKFVQFSNDILLVYDQIFV